MGSTRAEFRSRLKGITAHDLWQSSTCLGGVNAELYPIRMIPLGKSGSARLTEKSTLSDIVRAADERFPFLITLFGILPLDLHRMGFDSLQVGRMAFVERSSNLFLKEWVHEREISTDSGEVLVSDRLRMTPRLALLGLIAMPIYKLVFARRHKYLRARHAGRPA